VPLRLVNILASINFLSFASWKDNHIWKIMLWPITMHNNDDKNKNKFHDIFNHLKLYQNLYKYIHSLFQASPLKMSRHTTQSFDFGMQFQNM
jgi:hypothetical protein